MPMPAAVALPRNSEKLNIVRPLSFLVTKMREAAYQVRPHFKPWPRRK